MHQFRNRRREFFVAPSPEGRPPGKQTRLREQVIALRKQNLSVHDISRSLTAEGESLSPAAIAVILKQEGFAKLPRRGDDERPDRPRPSLQRRLMSVNSTFPHAAFAQSSAGCFCSYPTSPRLVWTASSHAAVSLDQR